MRIRMTKTVSGADDGVTVRQYLSGTEYVLGPMPRAEELALVFLREGWAELAEPVADRPEASPSARQSPMEPPQPEKTLADHGAAPAVPASPSKPAAKGPKPKGR